MAEELVLHARLFDLLTWLLPKVERFPRPYRSTVTQRMMNAALDCQEVVFTAQSARDARRRDALAEADVALNRCVFTCALRIDGTGSTTDSMHTSAAKSPRSASCWADGSSSLRAE